MRHDKLDNVVKKVRVVVICCSSGRTRQSNYLPYSCPPPASSLLLCSASAIRSCDEIIVYIYIASSCHVFSPPPPPSPVLVRSLILRNALPPIKFVQRSDLCLAFPFSLCLRLFLSLSLSLSIILLKIHPRIRRIRWRSGINWVESLLMTGSGRVRSSEISERKSKGQIYRSACEDHWYFETGV